MKKLLYSVAALFVLSLTTGCETDRYSVSSLRSTPALDIEVGVVAFDYSSVDSSKASDYVPSVVSDNAVSDLTPMSYTLYTDENMLYTYFTNYRIGEVYNNITIVGDHIVVPDGTTSDISYIQDQVMNAETKELVNHFKIVCEFTRVSNELVHKKYQFVVECPVFEYIESATDDVYMDPATYGVNILNTAGISSIKEICDDTYKDSVYKFVNGDTVTKQEYYLSTEGTFLWAPSQGITATKAYRWLEN